MKDNEDIPTQEDFLALNPDDQLNYWEANTKKVDEDIINKYEHFRILSYSEKLQYWDDNEISFDRYYETFTNDYILDIKPNSPNELMLYNKWVIDHYRSDLQNKIHKNDSAGFVITYKSYDKLIADYFVKIKDFYGDSKADFLQGQYKYIQRIIDYAKVKKELLIYVYNSFKSKSEEDIYMHKHDIVSVILRLEDIAKIFDVVKYKVFLDSEEMKSNLPKVHTGKYLVPDLSEEKVGELYDSLVFNKFIDESTNKPFFSSVFNNKPTIGIHRIKWIDKAEFNRQVNKATLIKFIEYIADYDAQYVNAFIKDNFEVFQLTKEGGSNSRESKAITSNSLTQTRKVFKNIKDNQRSELIKEIAKTIFKH